MATSDAGVDKGVLPSDSVDVLVRSWRTLRPDLDVGTLPVLQRLARLTNHINGELEDFFAAYGLSSASFYVLTTIERLAQDGRVSQTKLMEELGLTSGTISVRIGRLVEQGLVDSQVDPDSKRTTSVTLSDYGRELCERVAPLHLANERRLLSALNEEEEATLVWLLRKLLIEFEGSGLPTGAPAVLGLTIAPAHTAMAMRQSVGLPAVPALLVRGVDEGGPGARAGIKTGDLLARSRGLEIRSIIDLYRALGTAEKSRRLHLTVIRGSEPLELVVQLGEHVSVHESRPRDGGGRTARGDHRL